MKLMHMRGWKQAKEQMEAVAKKVEVEKAYAERERQYRRFDAQQRREAS